MRKVIIESYDYCITDARTDEMITESGELYFFDKGEIEKLKLIKSYCFNFPHQMPSTEWVGLVLELIAEK